MGKFTRFTGMKTDKLYGDKTILSKADNYTLSATEKTFYIGVTLSAASKTVTLGLDTGEIVYVQNEGATNAVTIKTNSSDTGVSLAADTGKIFVG